MLSWYNSDKYNVLSLIYETTTNKTFSIMKRLHLTVFLILFSLGNHLLAQVPIKGKITDKNNEPVIGASVLEKGTNNGTITGIDGQFTLVVAGSTSILQISSIGYILSEVTVGNNTQINLILEESVVQLGEVVVTALGFEESKDELGYATSNISNDVLKGAAENSVINSLSGKSTGVRISRNSSDPGAGAYMQIRGVSSIDRNSQPLIILDGIPISNDARGNNNNFAVQSRLNDINPNDIENVSVLKGASAAALWGTQALGGVIYITTKKGKLNQKMQVTYNSTFSIDEINAKYPVQSTFGQGTNGNYSNTSPYSWGDRISSRSGEPDVLNTSGGFFVDQNGKTHYPIIAKNERDVYDDSNFDQVFQTGQFFENNLSIQSGNENSSIYVSLGDLNQKGIIRTSAYRRSTAAINTTNRLNRITNLNTSVKYTKTSSNAIRRSVSNNGFYLGFLRNPADFDASGYRGDYYPSSTAAAIPNRQRSYRNPIGASTNAGFNNPLWTIREQENLATVDRIIASMNLTIKPTSWLDLIGRVGIDKFGQRGNEFYTPGAAAGFVGGRLVKEYASNSIFNMDYIAKAKKSFNSNFDGDILVGFNFNHRERVVEGTTIQNFLIFTDLNDGILDVNNALPENREATSSFGSERTVAGYTAANFSAYNQVFVNATLRAEWASTFGLRSDNAFFFPSTSVAWQFSKLPQLQSNLFSFGKLRMSYAEVGVQPSRYNTFPEFVTPNYSDQLGGSLNAGLFGLGGFVPSSNLGNPSLKPERKREIEIGTDLRFFQDKLSFSGTYYFNRTTDILLDFPIANSRGYNQLYSNAAAMENRGLELELGYNIYRNSDWNIDMKLLYFNNRNEVTDLVGLESVRLATGLAGVNNRVVVGQQHGVLWGPRTLRDENGNIVFDQNGFPVRDDVEGVIGDPNPDFQASAVGSISYKKLSLNFLFETFQGADIFAGTKSVMVDYGRWGATEKEVTASQNLLTYRGGIIPAGTTFRGDIYDFGAGPVALTQDWYTGPGAFFGGGNHELFIEDGSWTRLRELTLSYDLSADWLKNRGVDRLQLSATGRNLFLWTKFEGNDPDTNVSGVSASRGIDYFNNPSTRSYVFSLSLTF
jgi:TonB-linked SusC/RagA family outer membrane protein